MLKKQYNYSTAEHDMLVNILGTGESPQKFIAPEYLGNGTLKRLLFDDAKHKSSSLSFSALFTKKQTCLAHASMSLYDGHQGYCQRRPWMDYLYARCCPDACFFHPQR